jgi:hypothetical protein
VKISRPSPQVLVVADRRLPALLGLLVWIALVAIYYCTLFAVGPMEKMTPIVSLEQLVNLNLESWLVVLFPVIIVPYLVGAVRILADRRRLVFDGVAHVVEKGEMKIATFAEIRRLELRAVNGRCEELTICAVLNGGAELGIHSGGAADSIVALAGEIADILDVEVVSTI